MQRPLLISCASGAAIVTGKLWANAKTSNSYGGVIEIAFTPWAMIIGAVPAAIVTIGFYAFSPTMLQSSDLIPMVLGVGSALFCYQFQNMV